MKVMRKVMMKTNEFCVGDQISVKVRGMGKFTATAHKIYDNGDALFIFDQCVARRPMNAKNTNEGAFAGSELCSWIFNEFAPRLPAKITSRLLDIGIPSYGMMFGHEEDFYKNNVEPDNDEQLELMKIRRNRVTDYIGENDDSCGWYWLSNAMKKEWSSATFAGCVSHGNAGGSTASDSTGVRPYFIIG